MAEMSGAQIVARCLRAEGIDHIFGMRGYHITSVVEAAERLGIRFVEICHEQSAAFMADAYSRVTGKVGVVVSGTGPSTACTINGIQEAHGSSSPVLLIASQIDQRTLGKGWGDLHEVKDQHGLISAAVEHCFDVKHSRDIAPTISSIFRMLRNRRPRPYGVEIPANILQNTTSDSFSYEPAKYKPIVPDGNTLTKALEVLSGAQKPLIYVGHGGVVSGAMEVVESLAELLNAPVLTSIKGKGVLPESHELSLGNLGTEDPVRRLIRKTDVALVVGTRFSNRSTGKWSLELPARWIRIDIDPYQLFSRTHPALRPHASIDLVGDAKATLEIILRRMREGRTRRRIGFDRSEIAGAKSRTLKTLTKEYPVEMRLLKDIRMALENDSILVNDSTIISYWTRRYYEVREPRTFLWPMGTGTIGYALPAAIAAKLGRPERQVVAICGDRGFLFSCQELATAVQHNVPIHVVVFNDNGFGIVDHVQSKQDRRARAKRLANPDFVALTRAFGARALRIESVDGLATTLQESLKTRELTMIEVPVPKGFLRVPPDLAQVS